MTIRLPEDASVDGQRVDALLKLADISGAVLLGIVVAVVLGACLLFGRRSRAAAWRGENLWARVGVLGVALTAFMLVDGKLFAGTLRELNHSYVNFTTPLADPQTVRIEVNAQQWTWNARYAGPDGIFNTPDDVVTEDDIRIPLGRPVMVQLSAVDVIHDFALPNFRVKLDAVPGRIGRFWFEAKTPGRYELVCSQLCGVGHDRMRGVLTVLSNAEWEAWAEEASVLSARAYDPKDTGAHWGWDWPKGQP